MNDDNSLNSAFSNGYDDGLEDGYKQGASDERARCKEILESLFDEDRDEGPYLDALRAAYTALFLKANDASPPVASSPVGGEQR